MLANPHRRPAARGRRFTATAATGALVICLLPATATAAGQDRCRLKPEAPKISKKDEFRIRGSVRCNRRKPRAYTVATMVVFESGHVDEAARRPEWFKRRSRLTYWGYCPGAFGAVRRRNPGDPIESVFVRVALAKRKDFYKNRGKPKDSARVPIGELCPNHF
jgi:hypothetical protein